MEKVRILGIDPSLRSTGLAVVVYDTSVPVTDPGAFKTEACQVVVNPAKYTGKDAILNMLDMLTEAADQKEYWDVDNVIIESPSVMFHKAWSAGTISSISHISGGCIPIFGLEKAHIFRPTEWNKSRKKEVTHANTISILGTPDLWHYNKRVKSEKLMEHIVDAASLALFWIRSNYLEE